MDFINNLPHYIGEFLEIPAIQVAISVLSLAYAVLRVIASTSFGKKAIGQLKEQYNSIVNEKNALVEEHKAIVDEKDSQFTQLKQDYEAKLYSMVNYTQDKLTALKSALSQINNEQVKKIVEEIDLNLPTDTTISEEIEKAKEQVKSEFEQKVKDAVYEVLKNGEETINNNTVEEQIQ